MTPGPAAGSNDGSGLIQIGTDWFETLLEEVTTWFTTGLRRGYETLTRELFGTPVPSSADGSLVVVPPASNEPWHAIYAAVAGGEITILALVVLFVAIQLRHLLRIGNLGSTLEHRRSRYGGIIGAVAIIAWYWLAVVVLHGVDALTMALIPSLAELGIALAGLLPETLSNPALTLVLATVGGLSIVLMKMLYLIREVLLYIFLYGMPLGFALAFGNVPVLSRIAARLCRQFVPLAVLPLPAAVLLRGFDLLLVGRGGFSPSSVLLRYTVAIGVPILVLLVSWKTFAYAAPLTAAALSRTAGVAATAGGVAALGYAAGPRAATTAARYGTKAGAAQAVVSRAGTDSDGVTRSDSDDTGDADGGPPGPGGGGGHDGVESYRRLSDDSRFK